MSCPSKYHLGAAKRVLRYIAGTLDYGLMYAHVSNFKLHDRISTSGYVFTIGSSAVTWSSMKQEVIVLATTEAKYVVATSLSCQAICLGDYSLI